MRALHAGGYGKAAHAGLDFQVRSVFLVGFPRHSEMDARGLFLPGRGGGRGLGNGFRTGWKGRLGGVSGRGRSGTLNFLFRGLNHGHAGADHDGFPFLDEHIAQDAAAHGGDPHGGLVGFYLKDFLVGFYGIALGRQQAQHGGFRNGIPELGHQNGYFRHDGNWVESNG